MSRPRHAAEVPPPTRDDPIRREAYVRAMQTLAERPGLFDALTPDQRRALQEYTGPEILGRHRERRGR